LSFLGLMALKVKRSLIVMPQQSQNGGMQGSLSPASPHLVSHVNRGVCAHTIAC
jgi:hypothetical protein